MGNSLPGTTYVSAGHIAWTQSDGKQYAIFLERFEAVDKFAVSPSRCPVAEVWNVLRSTHYGTGMAISEWTVTEYLMGSQID
ncbi:hypothetical protein Hypma_003420 [Hypsizygus marmoreus]|uniref:Uncharacterized protein n=1 Tax=Hypsizygus marmoreus TaxID=39966 RepID=A0A369J6L3_HYPMA|nr:hypothetical protein Hypma_003420 [Hypsizygus marmoreus]